MKQSSEAKFLLRLRRRALNRLKNSPQHLEKVASLKAWAEHHPWLTVSAAGIAGNLISKALFGGRHVPEAVMRAAAPQARKAGGAGRTALDELVHSLGGTVRAAIVTIVSREIAKRLQEYEDESNEEGDDDEKPYLQ